MSYICERESCREKATVNCCYPGSDHVDYTLCAEHAKERGFCVACGTSYSESKELDHGGDGYCDECYAEIVAADEAMNGYEDDLFSGSDGMHRE